MPDPDRMDEAAGDFGPHDWHLADAETGTEVRRLGPDRYQLHHPDGTVEELTSAAFDRWRAGGGSEDR